MEQNRWKSWALWTSMAALAVWVVKTVWKLDIAEEVNKAMNLILPVVVGFGLINDPTNKTGL